MACNHDTYGSGRDLPITTGTLAQLNLPVTHQPGKSPYLSHVYNPGAKSDLATSKSLDTYSSILELSTITIGRS